MRRASNYPAITLLWTKVQQTCPSPNDMMPFSQSCEAVGSSSRLRQLRATILQRWIHNCVQIDDRPLPPSLNLHLPVVDFHCDGPSNRPRLGVDNIINIYLSSQPARVRRYDRGKSSMKRCKTFVDVPLVIDSCVLNRMYPPCRTGISCRFGLQKVSESHAPLFRYTTQVGRDYLYRSLAVCFSKTQKVDRTHRTLASLCYVARKFSNFFLNFFCPAILYRWSWCACIARICLVPRHRVHVTSRSLPTAKIARKRVER